MDWRQVCSQRAAVHSLLGLLACVMLFSTPCTPNNMPLFRVDNPMTKGPQGPLNCATFNSLIWILCSCRYELFFKCYRNCTVRAISIKTILSLKQYMKYMYVKKLQTAYILTKMTKNVNIHNLYPPQKNAGLTFRS